MEKEKRYLSMATTIQESILKANLMAMENIYGKMEKNIEEIGKTA